MTEETQVPTEPETQNQPASEAQTPEVAQQDSTAPEGQEAEEAEADGDGKPEKTPEQKELERLRRQLTKAQRINGKLSYEAQQLQEQIRQYAPPQTEQYEQQQQVDPIKLAREIATVEKVTEKSNAVFGDGVKRFGKEDFGAAVQTVIQEAGPLFQPIAPGAQIGKPTPLGEAILESEDAPSLIKFLAENPDVAAELEGLSPAQLGRKIGRIEAQMSAKPQPKPVSKAPQPAKPISASRGQPSLENASMDEYIAMRKAQGARWAR